MVVAPVGIDPTDFRQIMRGRGLCWEGLFDRGVEESIAVPKLGIQQWDETTIRCEAGDVRMILPPFRRLQSPPGSSVEYLTGRKKYSVSQHAVDPTRRLSDRGRVPSSEDGCAPLGIGPREEVIGDQI